jgi:hypothetical protein
VHVLEALTKLLHLHMPCTWLVQCGGVTYTHIHEQTHTCAHDRWYHTATHLKLSGAKEVAAADALGRPHAGMVDVAHTVASTGA